MYGTQRICQYRATDIPNPPWPINRFNIETMAVDSAVPLRVNSSCLTKSSFPPFHPTATPTLIEAGPTKQSN